MNLNTLNTMISLGLMSFSQFFFGNTVNINMERLMEKCYWSFLGGFYWTRIDRGQQEAWMSDFKYLCGGGNMKFMDVCMNSFLVLASYIPSWQKMSRIKICTSRFIISEKWLISSILIRLVLHRRIGWRELFRVPINRGRLPQNSRTSFS